MPKLVMIEGDGCIEIGDAKQEVAELSEQWPVGLMNAVGIFAAFQGRTQQWEARRFAEPWAKRRAMRTQHSSWEHSPIRGNCGEAATRSLFDPCSSI
jgi:hypothetical protein